MPGAPRLSASEIASLCTKAARGAGHEWGVAQEAGSAAVRLDAAGLPGPGLLAALLRQTTAGATLPSRPDPALSRLTNPDRPLCSLLTGCYLSDLGAALFDGSEVAFGPVLVPALLAAFVSPAQPSPETGISLVWEDGEIWIGPHQDAAATLAFCAGDLHCQQSIEVSICPAQRPSHLDPCNAAAVQGSDIAFLDGLARRTYVPESAESRARGAGEDA